MYKEYMLKCECWDPLDGIWQKCEFFFATENRMREYIKSKGLGIKVEAMFELKRIDW